MRITKDLFSFDEANFSELTTSNIGAWPRALKLLLLIATFFFSLGVGYYNYIEERKISLKNSLTKEQNLRNEFEKKSSQAANIGAYRSQMATMEKMFSKLIDQLPSADEVPTLLEDVTQRGVINGLSIKSIDLLEEQPREFYIEMPIKIKAEGGYHDLGAFVSGLAALPRIITLHDFSVSTIDIDTGLLGMTMEVKTYRYKPEDLIR